MGLDMYLYKCTKGRYNARKRYFDAIDEHWRKWRPIMMCMPLKEGLLEFDDAKLTDADKWAIEQCRKEEDEIAVSVNYCDDGDELLKYWRKFNALHGFIMKMFADVDDESNRDVLIGGKENISIVLQALEMTKEKLDRGEKEGLEIAPVPGFYFGSQEIDDAYRNNISEAIDLFKNIVDSIGEDEVVFYIASW